MENKMSSSDGSQVFVGVAAIGGMSGEGWVYKPESAVKQIIVRHGDVINSLIFICENGHHSPKFGGGGKDGDRTDKVEITTPTEYLTGISGTVGKFEGREVITTMHVHTNMSKYGPFGRLGGSQFSFCVEDGSECSLVGFHGRSGSYLVAIGIYARPLSTSALPKPLKFDLSSMSDAMTALSPRNPGPFGGMFGREWDDGVFPSITKIVVHVDNAVNAIRCVRFEYASGRDGNGSFWSPRHGDASLPGLTMHKILVDSREEFLLGITGYYSPIEEMDTIRSLSFMTNKGIYGPFGSQMGTYFCSPPFPTGKIVGFFGRASSFLHSIGVHMEYKMEEGVRVEPVAPVET